MSESGGGSYGHASGGDGPSDSEDEDGGVRHDRLVRTLLGHSAVEAVATHGTYIVSGSGDKTVIRLTGITRPDWITASGTIASNQLYDLAVDKTHSGAVERSTQRGFIAEVLDFLFAF